MSLTDPVYLASAAFIAGHSGASPECECPGFDEALLPSPELLLGRWVRSPTKFVGWDTYMEFFGLSGDKALQETEEPQEHVITGFSKDSIRIIHRLPWRDGLDTEYTIPIDGTLQPIPPAMVARASSSWKVNDLMSWVHTWDDGDGNPLHRGLRAEQKLCIGETNYALRYWRSLVRPNEMRINVEVTYADTGAYAVHTQRFFDKIDVDTQYAVAAVPRVPSSWPQLALWSHQGRGVRMAVLPHASNMPEAWEQLSAAERWQQAEEFPSAGRSSGAFLTSVREGARDAGLWVVCGVVFRATASEDSEPKLLQGVALIGADGWLHGVHTNPDVADDVFQAGSGDWPATQRARPTGVYDTELGRIAMCVTEPNEQVRQQLAGMGAELVVAPPATATEASRIAVALQLSFSSKRPHGYYTSYALCGPEPLEVDAAECASWQPVVIAP